MTSSEEDKGPPAVAETGPPQTPSAQVNGGADNARLNDSDLTALPNQDTIELTATVEPSGGEIPDHGLPIAGEDAAASAIATDAHAMANPITLPPELGMNMISPAAPLTFPQQDIDLMMALAQISAGRLDQPSVVTPAQVSLKESSFHGAAGGFDNGNGIHLGGNGSGPGLESFARIEFADSTFQMTTYAVIIGRDQRALEQARRDEKREQEYQRRVQENAAAGLPAPSPPSQDRGKFSKSYVSEEGGMLGPESDGDHEGRPAKRRRTSNGARSASGTPYQAEQAQLAQLPLQEKNANNVSNRQYVSHTPGAAAVDLTSLRPSPYHIPHIGIHLPGPNIASRTKAISRDHLKIEFNQERGVFEAIPMHKNGFFCDEVHYRDTKVVLKSGDRLQIKDVDFVFVINGVAHGKTGAEDNFDEEETSSKRYSEGGKEMSFEFESSHGGEIINTTEESSEVEFIEEGEEDEDDEAGEEEVMETIEDDGQEAQVKAEPEPNEMFPPPPPKKRGPGRPPKNGIRSKREERLLKKQAMEEARKSMPQPPPGEPLVKRKVGRPRKHPLPEGAEAPEKRRYKARKPKDGEGSDGEKVVKEKKREKPKTPPLELRIEDFTEEQLLKPTKNYSLLIDEVLTAALPGGLTLKQIYKRIQRKYPYYYFTVDTKGWESSVRHNLIGNDAFKKDEETHLWCRVEGIELEAGKKRKAPSPDHHGAGALHGSQAYGARAPIYRPAQSQGMNAAIQPGYQPANGIPYPGQGQAPYPGFRPGLPGPNGQQVVGKAQQPAPMQAQPGPPGSNPAGAERMHQAGAAALAYSSPFMSSRAPMPPSGSVYVHQATANGVAGAQQPGAIQRQSPVTGNVANAANAANAANGASAGSIPGAMRPAQQPMAQANGNPLAPLKPPIEPEAATYISNFKAQVVAQLQKRTPKAEIIALSAINRGIGLAQSSPVPELDSMESIVLSIFQQGIKARFSVPSTTKTAGQESSQPAPSQAQILRPALLETLLEFKASMVETLKGKLGDLAAEALLLSAMDRVLGFSDKSTMQPTDDKTRKEYEGAEGILMPHILRNINDCQRLLLK
jgi:hypothetical protein